MEFLPNFKLHRPESVEEAVALAGGEAGARYLAGGSDLLVNVRRGIEDPAALIDLGAVASLQAIDESDGGLSIGAGVSLQALARDSRVAEDYPAVAEAARAVAGPTHQVYGTVGGNLCLDTRCIFYNQSEWWRASNDYCLKHRGEICHVAPGGKRCFAAFSGDLAPALLVHGAEVEIAGPEGTRRQPLAELYRADGMDHLTLGPAELLTTVHLAKANGGARSAYAKARVRGSIDFPLAGAAVRLGTANGAVTDLAVALTAAGPAPTLVEGTDALIGRAPDEETLETLRELVRRQARPMQTTTTSPWYRRRVVAALAVKLARQLAAG
ncbi:MAG: 4-hydroxybenzoyl-CoA reductase subunit beta [Alphaproteobacteria bacterium]|jgi:4-hydroxybenzoyl-CoA reductase subunit beta|nr:4-hydroxybenzoyl-CoA reductase subunit beta [Alphaproteobacteria bacterium]